MENIILFQVIRNPDIGSAIDKLRLFIIYYLSASELPESELQVYLDTLQVSVTCTLELSAFISLT